MQCLHNERPSVRAIDTLVASASRPACLGHLSVAHRLDTPVAWSGDQLSARSAGASAVGWWAASAIGWLTTSVGPPAGRLSVGRLTISALAWLTAAAAAQAPPRCTPSRLTLPRPAATLLPQVRAPWPAVRSQFLHNAEENLDIHPRFGRRRRRRRPRRYRYPPPPRDAASSVRVDSQVVIRVTSELLASIRTRIRTCVVHGGS